jgi:hypothetical protein
MGAAHENGSNDYQRVQKGPNDRRLGLKHHLHHHLEVSQHEHLGASKHDHSTQRPQKVRRVSGPCDNNNKHNGSVHDDNDNDDGNPFSGFFFLLIMLY